LVAGPAREEGRKGKQQFHGLTPAFSAHCVSGRQTFAPATLRVSEASNEEAIWMRRRRKGCARPPENIESAFRRTCLARALLAGACLWPSLNAPAETPEAASYTDLHFAPNNNFDAAGRYMPSGAGFNLADITHVRDLRALPHGMKALVWVGQCNGADPTFIHTVRPYMDKPNVFGFYLMDDPDPRTTTITRTGGGHCAAEDLQAESDWIHGNIPGAMTFIVLMNLGSSESPSFKESYNPDNSHVDLFGVASYPCQARFGECRYEIINQYVVAAEAAGIPRRNMVPIYQTFGGGSWKVGGGRYVMPTALEMRAILERWQSLIAAPAFDYAYSWGVQREDQALESVPALQEVFALHNGAGFVRRQ
jgi:hypothetical protein